MKKNKIIIIIGIIFLLGIVSTILFTNNKRLNKKTDIDKVLTSEAYVNLPESAKKYIKETFDNTGEILNVEGNKEVNKPYLNPEYINYLEYLETETKPTDVSYEVIPDETIIDYVYNDSLAQSNDTLPSKYDLRNVNGKNYTTPLKDQGQEGLCWAYATASHMESKIMIEKKEPYNSNKTTIISPKYFDYATSYDGIIDNNYLNDIYHGNNRKLTEGGDFGNAIDLAIKNLGVVTDNWNDDDAINNKQKEANSVYHFSDSIYDVDSTIAYPLLDFNFLDLNNENDRTIFNEYNNGIKQLVKENGGAYISGHISGGYGCEVTKDNGDIFIGNSEFCQNTGNHAEQLIGWDDNFEYQYCKDKTRTKDNIYDITDEDCLENSVVTGKGAWLIRNSWGDYSQYAYYYIPYLTKGLSFDFLKSFSNKNWDNYYNLDYTYKYDWNKEYPLVYNGYELKDTALTSQKIVKLKVYISTQNDVGNIYFGNNYESLEKIAEFNIDYPGYYTIDLSNKNITINPNENYYLNITNKNGNHIGSFFYNYYLYTNNVDNSTSIKIKDYEYPALKQSNKNGYYQIRVNGNTEGIAEGELIKFNVIDKNQQKVNGVLYKENDVFANHVFANLYIPKTINVSDEYTIQAIYKGAVNGTAKLTFEEGANINGNGTESSPYEISNSFELGLIWKNPSANYILTNDIDLTYDTQNENGLYYNDGYGWLPLNDFTGKFDGQNHIIKGLYSNNGGLFGIITGHVKENNQTISIKNLKMTDVNINVRNVNYDDYDLNDIDEIYKWHLINEKNSGVGAVVESYSYDYEHDDSHKGYVRAKFELSNIAVINGSISEKYDNVCEKSLSNGNKCYLNAGGIIGSINYISYQRGVDPDEDEDEDRFYESIVLNNLYNGADIETTTGSSGGIIGNISYTSKIKNYFSNLENKGTIKGKKYAGGIIGSFIDLEENYMTLKGTVNLDNIINYGEIISENNAADFLNENELSDTEEFKCENCGKLLSFNNGYYKGDKALNYKNFILYDNYYNNVSKTSIAEIKNENFDNWDNFDTYWKNKADDNTNRIPMLKNSGFEYINVNNTNIKLSLHQDVNIFDYITPNNDDVKQLTRYSVADDSIIEINENGLIHPKKAGTTSINVISDYDGYEGTFDVSVYEKISGTEDEPWEIKNASNMELLSIYPNDYFVIDNDIDLSTTSWTPINNFKGHIDGNNHKISDLTIETDFDAGFIINVDNGASIKNLVFENVNIKGKASVGTLASKVFGNNVTISNIAVLNGIVYGDDEPYVGGIIGTYNAGENHTITALYNGAKVESDDVAAGIIGFYKNDDEEVTISNIINQGEIIGKRAGGLLGRVRATSVDISNSFQYGKVTGTEKSDDIIGTKENNNIINVNNIYYAGESQYSSESKNVIKKNHYDIANANYSKWKNFNNVFKQDIIDDIKRIPLLKTVNIEYTKLTKNKIEINEEDELNIYDLINTSNQLLKDISYEIADNDIITIDENGIIKGKRSGNTVIHIKSNYDGYGSDINVESYAKELEVVFFANSGEGKMDNQVLIKNDKLKPNTFKKEGYVFKHWNECDDDSCNAYNDEDTMNEVIKNMISKKEKLRLYAIWEKREYIIKEDYIYNISKKTHSNIFGETFDKNANEEIKVFDKNDNELDNDSIICTGSVTKLYSDNELTHTYINIVKGDTNRDGNADLSDVAQSYSQVMNNNIDDDLIALAGNVNNDDEFDLSDVAKMYSYYMNDREL